ncbi:MAG: ROK family protein [Anaerolineae bacterium]|nr:ROK family protein [Anaerolineae bacterium]
MTDGQSVVIAFDIGGTRLKAGLIREDGRILVLRRLPTPSKAAPDSVVAHLAQVAHELCNEAHVPVDGVKGIGVSIAAFVTGDGLVTATAHLTREWIGYDLRAGLVRYIDANYYFALDTPAPTLGEAYYGAGRGVQHFAYVTVSTGIGAGIVSDGRFFIGGLGWAGGVGHIIIDETSPRICTGCGNHGCLETFAAVQGIVATAREQLQAFPDSLLHELIAAHNGELTPRLVAEAAQHGDAAACEVWRLVGHALGIGLTNLVNIVSPTRIVVGGGIAQAGDLLLEPARAVIRERAFPPQHRQTEVVGATLGDLSGLYGAAAMVFHDLRINS